MNYPFAEMPVLPVLEAMIRTGVPWTSRLFELVFGYLAQGIAMVLFVHMAVGRPPVRRGGLLAAGLFLGVGTFVIRTFLPVRFGSHTLLVVLTLIGVFCGIFKSPLVRTCIASFVNVILIYLLEGITYWVMVLVLGQSFVDKISSATDPIVKAPGWLPPTWIFLIAVVAAYIITGAKHKEAVSSGSDDSSENPNLSDGR